MNIITQRKIPWAQLVDAKQTRPSPVLRRGCGYARLVQLMVDELSVLMDDRILGMGKYMYIDSPNLTTGEETVT